MGFGLIIIGDEILSGKRQDKHFAKMLALLSARGLALDWVQYVGDDRARITAVLARTFASDDIVLSTGGIGATPDDHTRQCAAVALGQPLELHPQAKALIQERIADVAQEKGEVPDYDRADNQQRLKMGEFPVGAGIIPNPFNKIPGFYVANPSGQGAHYFMPGFPVMAWPMAEWVLETFYQDQFHQKPVAEKSMIVFGAMESRLTPMMEALEAQFAGISVFSLPHVGDGSARAHIELGVKGDPAQVEAAFDVMRDAVINTGAEYRLGTVPGE